MACWVGAQGQEKFAKKAKICPLDDITHNKPKQKKNFQSKQDFPNLLKV